MENQPPTGEQSSGQGAGGRKSDAPGVDHNSTGQKPQGVSPIYIRLRAVMAAARYHGIELDIRDFAAEPGEASPSPATLVRWLRDYGAVAKGMRLRWRYLVKLGYTPPVVLLFRDGSAGLLVRTNPEKGIVWLRDPLKGEGEPPVPIDELRLMQLWTGDVVLIKRRSDESEADANFDFYWFVKMVLREKKGLRDIVFSSMVLSILGLFPAMIVMQVVDRVINYHSMATLVSLTGFVVILSLYEVLLTYARQELTLVVSTRLDARISLHAFNRLLALPLEFYERQQAGEVLGRFNSIFKVRDFLTGQVLNTLLDVFMLLVVMPVLFYMSPSLAWLTLVAAGAIGLIVVIMLPVVSRVAGKMVRAEMQRGAALYETVAGIRTVKTLALENTRRATWDNRTAVVIHWRLASQRLANWVSTMVQPLNMFINRGIILVGAYLVLTDANTMQGGALMAFMMLGGRVASPLVSLAKIMESLNEVTVSLGEAGEVLNQPTETYALTHGMRPPIKGALSFNNINFTYPGAANRALTDVTFDVPAGTMLGLVGRSGSGKSTITRLLQGVSREYQGYLRLDGVDLREINLHYLRRSFGVVLQDNFLFRGTIHDNITAGRPGLTLDDVIRAARLAGAEEFIERMPAGYETWIEEGSTNISGGQRQRLAIARAVISDPKLMILDEATSALDPESEALVNANLKNLAKGRTMVIVSHRLSSLVDCDQIAVMDQGRAIDIAPHEVLLERCDVYRTLWLQQNRHLAPETQAGGNPSAGGQE